MNDFRSERHWVEIDPSRASALSDARLQFHYAAQYGAAIGISYLPPQLDDSHTNLGWDHANGALISHGVRSNSRIVRVGVRPADLTLQVLVEGTLAQAIPLHGSTIQQAGDALRHALTRAGISGADLTLNRHYELPEHAVASGAAFDATDSAALGELSTWYANADVVLQSLRERIRGTGVRCWPHHFDIATLATVGQGRTSGAGLSPGDSWYDEPYFYVNARPAPRPEQLRDELQGGGTWHLEGWVGAVLPGSRLGGNGALQAAQARAFLESAFDACSRLAAD